ncbi:hypothetical protein BGZ94_005514 [Podila epigama]|nr:hypothetical protein BGZ94_005514 [Podila epigama]
MKFQTIILFLAVSYAYALVIKRATTAAEALEDAIFDDAKKAIEIIKTGITTVENAGTIGYDEAFSTMEPVGQFNHTITTIGVHLRKRVPICIDTKQCDVARDIFSSMIESFDVLVNTIFSKISEQDLKADLQKDVDLINIAYSCITSTFAAETCKNSE